MIASHSARGLVNWTCVLRTVNHNPPVESNYRSAVGVQVRESGGLI